MLETAPSRLMVECIAGINIVHIVDSSILSAEEVRGVVDPISDLLQGGDATGMLLNFENVRWMSSNMIAELIKLQRSIEAAGGALKLCCLPPEVRPVFSWCRVAFAIYADERAALDSF
jgi:anti-sigma B factor antagonist